MLTFKRFTLKKALVALLLVGLLAACDQSKPCIDGDDFGFPKVELDASGIEIEGYRENEVSKWKDTELVVDGTPLIFQVYGRWFPLLKGNTNVINSPCQYVDAGPHPAGIDVIGGGFKIDILSWPCFLTKGVGVYGLLMPTDVSTGSASPKKGNYDPIPNPNENISYRKSPPGGNTFHLGDPNTSGLWPPPATFDFESDPGGGVMPNKPFSVSGGGPTDPDLLHGLLNSVGDGQSANYERLYFKLLDSFYDDNSGSVLVKIRSGARSPYPGIFESMIIAVSDIFETSAETIYRRLTENTDFIGAVQAMLVLYIAIYALTYVMGMVSPETSQKIFLVKVIKFGIVVMIISPQSFEFFDDYLLKIFVRGMYQTVNIVSGAVAGPGVAVGERLSFFDDVLNKLFSPETHIKIVSLLWFPNPNNDWLALPNPKGIIFIPIIYVLLIFFVMTLFKTLMIYLMALISLGLLIAMAPIFIPFMLFERTKDLFEGWLKMMIGHWLQPVILFAMLTLFYVMLLELLYRTVGYRTCWNVWWSGELWPGSAPIDFVPGNLMAWMPNVRDRWQEILVPPFYFIDYNTFLTAHPEFHPGTESNPNLFLDLPDYMIGSHVRLVDYPSLNPDDPVDSDKIKDAVDGTVTGFYDVLIFGVVIFLMYKFADQVQTIGRDIAGITHGGPIEAGGGALWSTLVQKGQAGVGKAWNSFKGLGATKKGGGGAGGGGTRGGGRVMRGGIASQGVSSGAGPGGVGRTVTVAGAGGRGAAGAMGGRVGGGRVTVGTGGKKSAQQVVVGAAKAQHMTGGGQPLQGKAVRTVKPVQQHMTPEQAAQQSKLSTPTKKTTQVRGGVPEEGADRPLDDDDDDDLPMGQRQQGSVQRPGPEMQEEMEHELEHQAHETLEHEHERSSGLGEPDDDDDDSGPSRGPSDAVGQKKQDHGLVLNQARMEKDAAELRLKTMKEGDPGYNEARNDFENKKKAFDNLNQQGEPNE